MGNSLWKKNTYATVTPATRNQNQMMDDGTEYNIKYATYRIGIHSKHNHTERREQQYTIGRWALIVATIQLLRTRDITITWPIFKTRSIRTKTENKKAEKKKTKNKNQRQKWQKRHFIIQLWNMPFIIFSSFLSVFFFTSLFTATSKACESMTV